MAAFNSADKALLLEYKLANENFRALADIRFKLLALVPILSGAALALISPNLFGKEPRPEIALAAGILGFLVTLGVTFYDQRNSQLYNAIYHHIRYLQTKLVLPNGTQFGVRPGRELRFVFVWSIWHDRALALIYSAVLGAWLYPVCYAALMLKTGDTVLMLQAGDTVWNLSKELVSGLVVALATTLFVLELHRLDSIAGQRQGAHKLTQSLKFIPRFYGSLVLLLLPLGLLLPVFHTGIPEAFQIPLLTLFIILPLGYAFLWFLVDCIGAGVGKVRRWVAKIRLRKDAHQPTAHCYRESIAPDE
jgi:hypothetical protein